MKKFRKLKGYFLLPLASLSAFPLVISAAPSDDENTPRPPRQKGAYEWDIEYVTLPEKYHKFTEFSDEIKEMMNTYLNTKRMQMYKKVLSDEFENDFINTSYKQLQKYFKEKASQYNLGIVNNASLNDGDNIEFKLWIINTVEKIVARMLNKETQDETLNNSELYEKVLEKVMSLYKDGTFLTTYKKYVDVLFKYLGYISKGMSDNYISLYSHPRYEMAILIEIPLSFQELGQIDTMVERTKNSYQKLIDKIEPKLREYEAFRDDQTTEKDNWARNQLTNDNKFTLFQELSELEYYGMKNMKLEVNAGRKLCFDVNSLHMQLVEEETVNKYFDNKESMYKFNYRTKENVLGYLKLLKAVFDKKELREVDGYKNDVETQTFMNIVLLTEVINEQNVNLSKTNRTNVRLNDISNFLRNSNFLNNRNSNTFDNLIFQDERVHNIFSDVFNILVNYTNNNIDNLDSEFLIDTFLIRFKNILYDAFSTNSILYQSNKDNFNRTDESLYNIIIKTFETVINFYKKEIVEKGVETTNTIGGLLKNLKKICENVGLNIKWDLNSFTKTGKNLELDNKTNNYYIYKYWKDNLDKFLNDDNGKEQFKNKIINNTSDLQTFNVGPTTLGPITTSYYNSNFNNSSSFIHLNKLREKLNTKQHTQLLQFLNTGVLNDNNRFDVYYNFNILQPQVQEKYNQNSLAQDDMFYTITEKINNAFVERIEKVIDEESYNKYISFIDTAKTMYNNKELSKKYVQFIIEIREVLNYENLNDELNTLLRNKPAQELSKIEIKDEDTNLEQYYERLTKRYKELKRDLRKLNETVPIFKDAINKAKEVKASDVYTSSSPEKQQFFDTFLNQYEAQISDGKLNVYMSYDQLASQISTIDVLIKLLGGESDIETTDETYLNKLKSFINENLTNLETSLNEMEVPENNDNWNFDAIKLAKTLLNEELGKIKESLNDADYENLLETLPKLLEKQSKKQLLDKKLELHKLINDSFDILSETKKEKLKEKLQANEPELELIKVLLENEASSDDGSKDEKIRELSARITTLEASITEKDNKIQELEASVAEKDATILEKDNKIGELENSLTEKDNVINSKDEKINELETSNTQKDSRITELEASISDKDNSISEKDAKITELEAKIKELESTIKEKEERLAGLEHSSNMFFATDTEKDEKIKKLETSNAEKDKRITKLEKDVREAMDLVELLNETINHDTKLIETRNKELEAKNTSINQLNNLINELRENISELENTINSNEEANEEKVRELESSISEKLAKVKELEAIITNKDETENTQKDAKIRELENTIKEKLSKIKELESLLDKLNKDNINKDSTINKNKRLFISFLILALCLALANLVLTYLLLKKKNKTT